MNNVQTQPWQLILEKAYVLVQARRPSVISEAYLDGFTQRNLVALRGMTGGPVGTATAASGVLLWEGAVERAADAYFVRNPEEARGRTPEQIAQAKDIIGKRAAAMLNAVSAGFQDNFNKSASVSSPESWVGKVTRAVMDSFSIKRAKNRGELYQKLRLIHQRGQAYTVVQEQQPPTISEAYLAAFAQRNLNTLRAMVDAPATPVTTTADAKTRVRIVYADGRPATEAYYSLPPREALIAAVEQARGNNNTWQYPTSVPPGTIEDLNAAGFKRLRWWDEANERQFYAYDESSLTSTVPASKTEEARVNIRVYEGMPAEELFEQARKASHGAAFLKKGGETYVDADVIVDGDPAQSNLWISKGASGFLQGKYWINQDRSDRGRADVTVGKTTQTIRISTERVEEREQYKAKQRTDREERERLDTLIPPHTDVRVVPYLQALEPSVNRDNFMDVDGAHDRGARYFVAEEPEKGEAFARRVLGDKVADAFLAVWRELEGRSESAQPRRYIARSSESDDSFRVINQGSTEISEGSFARARRQFLQHDDVTDTDKIPFWDGVAGEMTTVAAWFAEEEAKTGQAAAEEKAVVATEEVHDEIPPDSDVKNHDQLSVWGGYLAAVRQPNMHYDVDLDKMAAPWIIHYVDEGDGKPARADKYPELIGVYFRDSAGTNRFSYARPMSGMSSVGTFLNGVRYWLRSDVKDPPPEAMRSVKRRWEEQGYIDTSDYSWQEADKLTKGQWIKVFAIAEPGKDLDAVYDAFPDDYTAANAVYTMLSRIAEDASTSPYPGHGQYADEGTLLLNLPGVFKTSKDTRFLWKIEAAEVRARKSVKPRVKKPTSEDEEEATLQVQLQDRQDLLDLASFYFTRLWDKDRQPDWGSRGSNAPSGSSDNNPFQRFVDGGLIVQSGTRFLPHAGLDVDLFDVTPKALELLESHGLRKKIEEDVAHRDQPDEGIYSRDLHYALATLRRPLVAEETYQEKVKLVADVKRNKTAREALLALFDLSYPDGVGDPFNTPRFIVSTQESFDDIPKKAWDWLVKHGLVQWYSRTYHPSIMLTEDGLVAVQILRGGSLPRNVVFDVYDDE